METEKLNQKQEQEAPNQNESGNSFDQVMAKFFSLCTLGAKSPEYFLEQRDKNNKKHLERAGMMVENPDGTKEFPSFVTKAEDVIARREAARAAVAAETTARIGAIRQSEPVAEKPEDATGIEQSKPVIEKTKLNQDRIDEQNRRAEVISQTASKSYEVKSGDTLGAIVSGLSRANKLPFSWGAEAQAPDGRTLPLLSTEWAKILKPGQIVTLGEENKIIVQEKSDLENIDAPEKEIVSTSVVVSGDEEPKQEKFSAGAVVAEKI